MSSASRSVKLLWINNSWRMNISIFQNMTGPSNMIWKYTKPKFGRKRLKTIKILIFKPSIFQIPSIKTSRSFEDIVLMNKKVKLSVNDFYVGFKYFDFKLQVTYLSTIINRNSCMQTIILEYLSCLLSGLPKAFIFRCTLLRVTNDFNTAKAKEIRRIG